MNDSPPEAPKTYKIPEVGPNLGDWISAHALPHIFRFVEYCIVAGFVLFIGMKANNSIFKGIGYFLMFCVLFLTTQHMSDLVRRLEFRKRWTMRLTAAVLHVVGIAFYFLTMVVIYGMASTQAGLK